MGLKLQILPGLFAVSRLAPSSEVPAWATAGSFRSVCWTPDEMSIVCAESLVPDDVKSERGWRCLRIEGPLDFGLTGILLKVAEPLAQAGIPIFTLSTYDTDYVMVKDATLPDAARVLTKHGHLIR